MSYNGSGTFVINTAGQPVVSGTVISSTAFNALTADLATGLSTAITKDGQTTPTANIPMGNNKITGLAVGTAATDAANLSQVQSTAAKLVNSVSGADTITGTMSPNLGAYATGQMFYFVAVGANTGAVTINIDSLGAKSITRDGTTALAAGDIQSGEVCVIVYDGTQFQLVNGASQSASIVTENLTVNKATVLNESGGDNDTRIEGDTDANLVFVDASTDRVGIGTSSPAVRLDVSGFTNVTNASSALSGTAKGTLRLYDSTAMASGVGAGLAFLGQATTGSGAYTTAGSIQAYKVNGTSANDAFGLQFTTRANGSGCATVMTLDDSGNLGLGVTPSAWDTATFKGIQVGANNSATLAGRADNVSDMFLGNNVYFGSAAFRYVGTGTASYYRQDTGNHVWFTATSGTAGNALSGGTTMILNTSGNLGVGTTSPAYKLHVSTTQSALKIETTTAAFSSPSINLVDGAVDTVFTASGSSSVGAIGTYSNHAFLFYTNNTERARITSGGVLLVNRTSNQSAITDSTKIQALTSGSDWVSAFENSHASDPYGLYVRFSGSTPNNTANLFGLFDDTTNRKFEFRSNGGLANYSANDVNLASDERLKKDISPLNTAWDKVKNIEVVNYRYKDCNEGDPLLYGVIAQQVQPIVPELVVVTQEAKEAVASKDAVLDKEGSVIEPAVEAKEATPEYYGIREQPMYWLAIKALQEAMTKIETLEAKVAALEAK